MARPKKQGLEYFPLDVDIFYDEKLEAISGEFGIKGELATIKLLCAIYRNGYFIVWNDLTKMKLARSIPGASPDLLNSIVLRLVKWDFFNKGLFESARVLSSKGIQTRWKEATRKRIKTDTSKLEYWILDSKVDNQSVSGGRNNSTEVVFGAEMQQSKVKESKVKKSNTDVLQKSDIDIIEIDDVPDFVKEEREKALIALEEQKRETRGAAALENFDWQKWLLDAEQNTLFLEAPCKRHKITHEVCVTYLRQFVSELRGVDYKPKSLGDLRRYFYAWIAKRYDADKGDSVGQKGKLTTALENVDRATDRLKTKIQNTLNGNLYDDY